MVRVRRRAIARDPVVRRSLRRDARALGRVDPHVRWVEHPLPALKRPLGGRHFDVDGAEEPDARLLFRLLVSGVVQLGAWEAAGMPTPGLDPLEWRVVDGRLEVACLTLGPMGRPVRDDIRLLCQGLVRWWGESGTTALDSELSGFAALGPDSAEDAGRTLIRGMATALARTRHHLARAERVLHVRDTHYRLLVMLRRLGRVVVPPVGMGAMGVSLEGQVRSVQSDGTSVSWGLHGEVGEVVVDKDGSLNPAEARRLLRARAAAPPNARLQAEVGGDEAFTEAICKWVANAHHLRTITKLVEATGVSRAG